VSFGIAKKFLRRKDKIMVDRYKVLIVSDNLGMIEILMCRIIILDIYY